VVHQGRDGKTENTSMNPDKVIEHGQQPAEVQIPPKLIAPSAAPRPPKGK
jgi:hypothetical protein